MPKGTTTQLLLSWAAGDKGAFDRLFHLVYDELRTMAHHRLRGNARGVTLNTTLLVHEAYLRLVDAKQVELSDRAHFMAVASRAMRWVLVDHARARHAEKRGGADRPVQLDGLQVAGPNQASLEIIALNDALERLGEYDERLARLVEYRFFGGMEYEDIARATDASLSTVKRDWVRARAWLYAFMSEGDTGPVSNA